MMKNKIAIVAQGGAYDVVVDGITVVARCWDGLLADSIRDAVEDYMKKNYKICIEETVE